MIYEAMTTQISAAFLAREVGSANLGDARRSKRLAMFARSAVLRPEASFPMMADTESELEGIYRFLNNDQVTPEAILEPHCEASATRALESNEVVLVAHDTTYLKFTGDRDGMGRVHVKDQGFWAHVALGLSLKREVHGVLGLRYGTRLGASKWKGSRRLAPTDAPAENRRWLELPKEVATRLGSSKAVHLMDREADWFELMKELLAAKERFVIRLTHDRLLEDGGRVSDLWREETCVVVEREVRLSGRAEGMNARQKLRHPTRKPRTATLEIRGTGARIRSGNQDGVLDVHIVRVAEIDPPENTEPVVWNLVTTEPVTTEAELLQIVDMYRARWVIEEYFKALKTGCAFEKRQLGSYAALLNALAVFLPVAWTLLRLRDACRSTRPPSATALLEPELLRLLRLLAKKRKPLPPRPSAAQITYAIAGLGGHLPRNGDPGWQTLGRGLERLLEAASVLRVLESEM